MLDSDFRRPYEIPRLRRCTEARPHSLHVRCSESIAAYASSGSEVSINLDAALLVSLAGNRGDAALVVVGFDPTGTTSLGTRYVVSAVVHESVVADNRDSTLFSGSFIVRISAVVHESVVADQRHATLFSGSVIVSVSAVVHESIVTDQRDTTPRELECLRPVLIHERAA